MVLLWFIPLLSGTKQALSRELTGLRCLSQDEDIHSLKYSASPEAAHSPLVSPHALSPVLSRARARPHHPALSMLQGWPCTLPGGRGRAVLYTESLWQTLSHRQQPQIPVWRLSHSGCRYRQFSVQPLVLMGCAVKQIHPFSFTLQSPHSPAAAAPVPGN